MPIRSAVSLAMVRISSSIASLSPAQEPLQRLSQMAPNPARSHDRLARTPVVVDGDAREAPQIRGAIREAVVGCQCAREARLLGQLHVAVRVVAVRIRERVDVETVLLFELTLRAGDL